MKGPFEMRMASKRGASIIEFALSSFLLCLLLLVFVDFGRMILIYNGVSNAARAGVRYAIVHGANRTVGNCADCASGPGDDPPAVVNVVGNYASSAALDRNRLTVNVTYPEGANVIGSLVQIRVRYQYDPFLGHFPMGVTLRARSQGRIAF